MCTRLDRISRRGPPQIHPEEIVSGTPSGPGAGEVRSDSMGCRIPVGG